MSRRMSASHCQAGKKPLHLRGWPLIGSSTRVRWIVAVELDAKALPEAVDSGAVERELREVAPARPDIARGIEGIQR